MKIRLFLLIAFAAIVFAFPQISSACQFQGHVFCDSNSNGTQDFGEPAFANIKISISVNGVPQPWNTVDTDVNGFYVRWAPAGSLVEVIVDTADADLPADAIPTTPVTYSFPNACSVNHINVADFGFFSEECACPPCVQYPVKTQGYWKHNTCYWADPPDNNGYQEEFDALDAARNEINVTWWYDNFGDLNNMQAACSVMQAAQGGSQCDKARAQLLALMFNVVRGYVPADASITSPDASTVGDAIDMCIYWIVNGNCKAAQSLACSINEGLIFGESPSSSAQSNVASTPSKAPTGDSLKH